MLLARWLAGVWSKRGRLLAEFPRETLLVGHHHPLYTLIPTRVFFDTFIHSTLPLRPDSPIWSLRPRRSTCPNLTFCEHIAKTIDKRQNCSKIMLYNLKVCIKAHRKDNFLQLKSKLSRNGRFWHPMPIVRFISQNA